MTTCDRLDELRDYAFDELDSAGRIRMQQHLSGCEQCSTELDRLQLTTAALRILPDRQIPQRIAFVSDKVFEPSPVARWLAGFWNSAPRLGFASACVLAFALIVSAQRRPAPTGAATPPAQTANVDISRQVDEAVAKAVERVRVEDAAMSTKITQAALAEADRRHDQEHRALMVAMEENLTVLQKRLSTFTMLASNDAERSGAGQ